jgi:hypothetical protein
MPTLVSVSVQSAQHKAPTAGELMTASSRI